MILKNGKRIDGLGDNMPIGSIVEYNGTNIPDGWEILPGDANVYIGKDRPIEGQEVWIQKGKNLLDMNKVKTGWGLTSNLDSQGFVEDANWFLSHPIPVEGGKSYFASGLYYANGDIQTFKEFYDKEHNFISNVKSNPAIAPDNAAYMYVDGRIDRSNEAMVVQGVEASAYEPYIGKKIFVKNDEGVYEEFYNEEEHNKNHYSLKERRIGTWINGKPLYQKIISFTTSWNTSYEFAHGIQDYDRIWLDMSNSYFFAPANNVSIPLISNSYYGDNTQWIDAMIYGDKVLLYSSGGWGTGWEKIITINYTKTTD